MSDIFYPSLQFCIRGIFYMLSFTVNKQLFDILHSLFKAGQGLTKLAKVWVIGGARSEACIY